MDIFTILGNFGSFFTSIVLLLWTILRDTDPAKDFFNWVADAAYGKSWYGEYSDHLKGTFKWVPGLRIIGQPYLDTDLENRVHFGHVSSKPSDQICWTILPQLTCSGIDGIKFDTTDSLHRDTKGKVMLKVSLENLMQLLVRDPVRLNESIPWGSGCWRQKTGYGFIELSMHDGEMFGFIKIDPIPYHHTPPDMSLTGSAVNLLWQKGYAGFPDDLFDGPNKPGECISLWSKLDDLPKTGNMTEFALTPSAIGNMLHRLSLLFMVEPCPVCGKLWYTTVVALNILAAKFLWQTGGHDNVEELAVLAGSLGETASKVICTHNNCAAKKHICEFLHNVFIGAFSHRCVPAWVYRQDWFGPSAVYFGRA